MESRLYEFLIALDTSVPSADAEVLLTKLQGLIGEATGTVKEIDRQGIRKLAFKVRGKMDAQFFALRCEAPSVVVKQIEDVLRLNEGVVRYMTTRLDPSVLVPATPPEPKPTPTQSTPTTA
jgi:small subunit ribosomal protein S6